ncbi:AzlC family ABC transporter permease [Cereibacter sp. SYSU M97828]|nr:AzlC family ABC transporter permease [Cereibacter flavus]
MSPFRDGLRGSIPFVFVVSPFGLLFGVVGTEAGLNLLEVMGFSVLVIAGASQFAALQLYADNAPTLIILATALAVNLRLAMYSAALTPHFGAAPMWQRALIAYALVDQNFAGSMAEFERREMTTAQKVAYFAGASATIMPAWYLASLIGAVAGSSIPPWMALDFALPITFLAMIGPMLRTLPQVAACIVSVAASLFFAFLPYGTGVLVAAALAMVVGAQVELWQKGCAA